MLALTWLAVAWCGGVATLVTAAPQDVQFDFEKSVVVQADPAARAEVKTVRVAQPAPPPPPPPPPRTQVVNVHKTHSFNRQAAENFHQSQSGQALDNAGAQLFNALGNAATSLGDFLSRIFTAGSGRTVVVQGQGVHDVGRDTVRAAPAPAPAPAPASSDGNLVFFKNKRIF